MKILNLSEESTEITYATVDVLYSITNLANVLERLRISQDEDTVLKEILNTMSVIGKSQYVNAESIAGVLHAVEVRSDISDSELESIRSALENVDTQNNASNLESFSELLESFISLKLALESKNLNNSSKTVDLFNSTKEKLAFQLLSFTYI